MKKQFYTIKEVCEILRVSEATVYRWIKSGKLEAVQMSSKSPYRIPAYAIPTYARVNNLTKGGQDDREE